MTSIEHYFTVLYIIKVIDDDLLVCNYAVVLCVKNAS